MAMEMWRPRSMARSPFREMTRDIDDMMTRMFGDWLGPRATPEALGWAPPIDVLDRKDEIVVRADLPGIEQRDLEVNVERGVLTIRGSRQEERETKEGEGGDYYCCERWAGSFTRSVALPPGVDPDRIRATFKNGVLEVHVPKTPQATGKKIEIKAA